MKRIKLLVVVALALVICLPGMAGATTLSYTTPIIGARGGLDLHADYG